MVKNDFLIDMLDLTKSLQFQIIALPLHVRDFIFKSLMFTYNDEINTQSII